jgi:hypothetical protein
MVRANRAVDRALRPFLTDLRLTDEERAAVAAHYALADRLAREAEAAWRRQQEAGDAARHPD